VIESAGLDFNQYLSRSRLRPGQIGDLQLVQISMIVEN
jgi:hypothetical protein